MPFITVTNYSINERHGIKNSIQVSKIINIIDAPSLITGSYHSASIILEDNSEYKTIETREQILKMIEQASSSDPSRMEEILDKFLVLLTNIEGDLRELRHIGRF